MLLRHACLPIPPQGQLGDFIVSPTLADISHIFLIQTGSPKAQSFLRSNLPFHRHLTRSPSLHSFTGPWSNPQFIIQVGVPVVNFGVPSQFKREARKQSFLRYNLHHPLSFDQIPELMLFHQSIFAIQFLSRFGFLF